jgi:predicted DNA-binding protein
MNEPIRFTLTVSPDLAKQLEQLSENTGVSKADIIRRGIKLFDIAVEVENKKQHLGITTDPNKLDTELKVVY